MRGCGWRFTVRSVARWGALAALLISMPVTAAECLLATKGSDAAGTAYRDRDDRCEGLLSLFVTGDNDIQLIGYHRGIPAIPNAPTAAVAIHVIAPPTKEKLALRAIGRTSQTRYEMDTMVEWNQPFRWRQNVITERGVNVRPADLGIVACSNRCMQKRDTTYFPVWAEDSAAPTDESLAVLLRSELNAGDLQVTLRPASGGQGIDVPAQGLKLLTSRLTRIVLPKVTPGTYLLEVDARDLDTQQPMGSLQARLYISTSTQSSPGR